MLFVKNIKKSFGGVQAIKGFNFVVPKGKITALIGPNGAGKTTLFDIICGLIKPDEGVIFFEDSNITGLAPHLVANRGISRTFQQVRLFKNLTIFDHLTLIKNNDDARLFKNIFLAQVDDAGIYKELLGRFGLTKPLATKISDLSFGQRKLLQIVMALQKTHKLLMFDEPVAGVNSVVRQKIEDLLLELKGLGETMLIIDHDMVFVRRLADYVVAFDAGQVVAEGTPNEVLNNQVVIESYLGK